MDLGEQSSLTQLKAPSDATAHAGPRCQIWGVLNRTPDSFSDGGCYLGLQTALEQAERMSRQGAHVIDVGGESSRPAGTVYGDGADHVSVALELERVVPVVVAIRRDLGAVVSVDTVKAEVARQALEAGATIVNDVSCGASDALLDVVAEKRAELVLMHTRGRGELAGPNLAYGDLVADVVRELMRAVARAVARGVERERIWIDPGLGFAKSPQQSVSLVAQINRLVVTGHRVLVGPSRKSFIAAVAPHHDGEAPAPSAREGGTAAAVTMAVLGGAHAVRVHDVAAMRQAVMLAESAARVRAL